jgi:2'-5' RNA ligase
MSKVYTSAVVIIPPEKLWGPIQMIREEFDRNFRRWMPHITLLYPFRPEHEFDLLELSFKKICENLKSFEIHLESFNFFQHGKQRYTLWLEPKPQKLINNLQRQIQVAAPDCNDVTLFKGGFTPHLSLGQITGRVLLDKTLLNLKPQWKSLQFTLDRIFIIAREASKNSIFQIKKIIFISH